VGLSVEQIAEALVSLVEEVQATIAKSTKDKIKTVG
jgi:hypothetical protein